MWLGFVGMQKIVSKMWFALVGMLQTGSGTSASIRWLLIGDQF
jgi:hypothetical protein